jgi:hypothetical protein
MDKLLNSDLTSNDLKKKFKKSNESVNEEINEQINESTINESTINEEINESTINTKSKQKKVGFNSKVKVNIIKKTKPKIESDTVHHHMINSLNNFTLSDPDYINPEDELNEEHLIIDKDPTDLFDEDEKEILEDEDTISSSETEEKTEYDELIKFLFNTFLNKFPHLDNFKNRQIIHSMFKMAVTHMPEYVDKPIFYLNFVESSIKQLTQSGFNDIVSNSLDQN